MDLEKKLKLVYHEARRLLVSEVGEDTLNKQLDYYHKLRFKTLGDVFNRLMESLRNRQSMPNSIGEIEKLKKFVFNFNPQKTYKFYGENWKLLFNTIKKQYTPPGPMVITNRRSYWVIYTKGILSSAKFLSNFKSAKDFDKFVKSFSHNQFTIASLPMLLEKEIAGLGFPLACDFLKELGYSNYGKPDVHIKDIFYELGLADSKNDYEIFKTIVKIGLVVKEEPVIVDKIFWLLGSGNFYFSNVKIDRQKAKFIREMKLKL
jgi:hypothetical protein